MELIYLLIFLISCFIEDIHSVLLKKIDINGYKDEKILLVSEEPSLIQCAQKCRFIDKDAIVDFKNSKCTCTKYKVDEGQEYQGALIGVFVNEMMRKSKKREPLRPKPVVTRVMNIVANKTAQQSENWGDNPWHAANKAIDGSEVTRSVTKHYGPPWWSVDLKTTTDIMYMVLNGEIDDPMFNKGLSVETRQEESGEWIACKNIGDLSRSPFNFTCDNPTNARFVKVSSIWKAIYIYEFEVYARVIV